MQISSPINLFSGEFYFMQAIMKVGVNTHEHLGVGVRLPDGQKHRPIVIDYLYCEIPGNNRNLSEPIKTLESQYPTGWSDKSVIGSVPYDPFKIAKMKNFRRISISRSRMFRNYLEFIHLPCWI